MKYLIILCFSLSALTVLRAQGDDCFNATNLGALPTPNMCNGAPTAGVGAQINQNGTTIGSTPGNPYVYMTDCGAGTVDMSIGSNDVWYSFESTGTVLELSLTGLMPNTNIGLWTGNCLNLSGIGCVIGDAAGNVPTTLFEALAPGQTYFIQISGNTSTANGNFTLNLNNNVDCNDCYQGGSLVANPPPINGVYSAGQTVEFCFTLTDYNQVSSNWLHALQVEWSSGWETTTANVVTNPPVSGSGAGVWTWYPNGIGTVNGVTWPSGFYYDHFSIPGWGESNAQAYDLEFCWSLTTLDEISCSSSEPLSVSVNTSADGESGSWTSPACGNDPEITFEGVLSCCAMPPDIFSTDLTCAGASDGSATAVAQGTVSPWSFQWYDGSGNLIASIPNSPINTNVLPNLAPGTYTVVVTDFAGCASGNSVTVNDYAPTPPIMSSTDVACGGGGSNGSVTATAQGANGPWTYVWYDQSNTVISTTPMSPSNTNTVSNLPVGNYTVVISDISNCTSTNSVSINNPVLTTPTFDPLGSICEGDPINLPSTSIEGITGVWDPPPTSIASATYTFIPFPGQCANTTTMFVQVEPAPSVTITGGGIVCAGGTIDLTATLGGLFPMVVWTSPNGTFSSNTATTTTFTPSITSGIATVIAVVSSPICMTSNQESVQIVVGNAITPTFTQIPAICSGDALNLPLASTNGIVGTWSPAPDNSTTTTYTFTPDVGQCALDETMTVDVIQAYSSTDVQSSCDSYTWIDGVTYTTNNNTATYLYTTSQGCDSLITLDLTITNASPSTEDVTICDNLLPYTWNGLTFAGAGSQTATLTSAAGCDSLATLNLTVNPEVTSTTDLTICDDLLPYTWNGLTFTGAGSQTATLTSAAGCDSLATLDLTVNPEVTSTTDLTICDDLLPYTWNGLTFVAAGSQTATLTSAAGCDSLATLNLTVNPEVTSTTDTTICDTELPFDWNGLTFAGAGSQTATLTSAAGCDSLATLNLTVNSEVTSTTDLTICDDLLPYTWNGLTFVAAGSQTVTLTSAAGCDSLATLNLIVNPEVTSTTDLTICDDLLPYTWNGLTFVAAGSQTATLTSAAGCDSLATLNLIVNPSTTGTDVITACDTYTWIDGNTYTTSNNSATWILTNASGCDSTVTLDLTITNSNSGTDTQTSCDTYTWIDGNTYTISNNSATWILTNASGCDSTVTLDLTINNTPSFTISGTDPSVCNVSDGSITISGLTANTSYTLSYDSLSIASQVSSMTTDVTGKFVINGLSAGLYANFSISLNGCEYTSVDVIDLNNPGAPIIDNQSSLTECDTYTLADITGSNLSGNESYYTEANGGGTPLNAGDVISATQTIYIYDILGTCADESSFTITVDYTPSLTDPGPQEVCESYFLPLSISGTNLSGNENYYSDLQSNGGTVISDEITSSQTVYIYDANGACSNEISFEITINELPTLVSFTGEGTYCEGEAINNLFAEVSGTPDYILEYTLDGNPLSITSSNSSIVLGNTSGVYILTALNDYFCSVSINAMQTITINSIPNMPIVSGDTSYCENAEVADIQASEGLSSPTWYSDLALTQIIGNDENLTPSVILGSTTYYVTSTENDCEGPASEVTITFENCEIIIPTAFTPDDDLINDTWELGNIDEIYPKNVVSIFNRWGNKIYESTQGAYAQRPWNGIYNDKKLPNGSYYFIIEFNDDYTENTNGTVSILKK